MRNHGLCEMRASKTAHPRWCSKERLFSNRDMYIMRLLPYHSDLMREPWDTAFNKGDPKAVAAFYTEDAVLLPPTHEVLKGPAEIEKYFASLFGAGVSGHKLVLLEANGAGSTVVAAARWSAKGKDG